MGGSHYDYVALSEIWGRCVFQTQQRHDVYYGSCPVVILNVTNSTDADEELDVFNVELDLLYEDFIF
jgi:hypothetical protein